MHTKYGGLHLICTSKNAREFCKLYISVAIPMILQGFIQSSLNIVDSIMVGKLGEPQIAAVGLANQVIFIITVIMYATNNGCSIFTAQYWGLKDIENIKRITGIGLKISAILSISFAAANMTMSDKIMGIFTEDPEVILLGSQYLKIIAPSIILMGISYTYAASLKSTGNVKVAMRISVMAVILNTVLNYAFIYGKFYLPSLGVNGIAIATIIARFVECTFIVIFVIKKKKGMFVDIKELFNLPKELIKKYYKTSMPIIINSLFWVVGLSIYKVIYARVSTSSIVAINIVYTLEALTVVFFLNMANAGSILIGKNIGKSDYQTAKNYSKYLIYLGAFTGILVGIILILLSESFLSMYQVGDSIKQMSHTMIYILSTLLIIKALNSMIMLGILRSGGDTKYGLIVDVIGLYGVGIPLALLGVTVFGLQIQWVYLLVFCEEIAKLILFVPRYISNKWMNNLVNNEQYNSALEIE